MRSTRLESGLLYLQYGLSSDEGSILDQLGIPGCSEEGRFPSLIKRHEGAPAFGITSNQVFMAWVLEGIRQGLVVSARSRRGRPTVLRRFAWTQRRLVTVPIPFQSPSNAPSQIFLDQETTKVDALIAKIREGIEKLKSTARGSSPPP